MSRIRLARHLMRAASVAAIAIVVLLFTAGLSWASGLTADPFLSSSAEALHCSSGCWVGSVSVVIVEEYSVGSPHPTETAVQHAQYSFVVTEENFHNPPIMGEMSIARTTEASPGCVDKEQFSGSSLSWGLYLPFATEGYALVNYYYPSGVPADDGQPPESYSIAVDPIGARGTDTVTESGPCGSGSHSSETVQYMDGVRGAPNSEYEVQGRHSFGTDRTHLIGTEVLHVNRESEGSTQKSEETITYDLHLVSGSQEPTCSETNEVGIAPNCHPPTPCPTGESGTQPNCHPPTTCKEEAAGCTTCAAKGEVGTAPNCHKPPVVGCDAYWTKPQQRLTVPAASGILGNDVDPSGSPLTVHVVSINFGLSSHSYSINPTTGALTFNPGRQTKPFEAVITYRDTDALGLTSLPTSIRIYVQSTSPSASQLAPCPASTGSFQSFLHTGWTDYGSHCTTFVVTMQKVPISVPSAHVKGVLSYEAEKEGNNNLCWSAKAPNTWKLKTAIWAKWEGTPIKADEITIRDNIEVDGHELHISVGVGAGASGSGLDAGFSIGLESSSTHYTSSKSDSRSNSKQAASEVTVKIAAERSHRIKETLTPELALPGVNLHKGIDATKSYPSQGAHACIGVTQNAEQEELWYWIHGAKECSGNIGPY